MKIFSKCIIILILLSYAGSHPKFMLTGSPHKAFLQDAQLKHPINDFTQLKISNIAEINLNYISIENPVVYLLAKGELEEDTEEVLEEELVQEKAISQESVKEQKAKPKPDYSNLTTIPYNILAGEYASLKEEKFKAELYPKRIADIPNELAITAKKNKKLVVLGTKKGDNKQYLIIQKDKVSIFERAIKSGKTIKFVFSPVALYNSCPVIELIDII